jgi:GntR family transcriptional regulator
MNVEIDVASSTPPHEQLHQQLRRFILAGALPPGSKLPAIRQLAADLGLAPGTVQRAYRDLEGANLVRSRRPTGTFVTDSTRTRAEHREALQELAARFASQARQLGVPTEEALSAVRQAYE